MKNNLDMENKQNKREVYVFQATYTVTRLIKTLATSEEEARSQEIFAPFDNEMLMKDIQLSDAYSVYPSDHPHVTTNE